ncbi:hypothetical protein L209DRAFT_489686 [Thermothelomyces heterothallicus CBS 203.75]
MRTRQTGLSRASRSATSRGSLKTNEHSRPPSFVQGRWWNAEHGRSEKRCRGDLKNWNAPRTTGALSLALGSHLSAPDNSGFSETLAAKESTGEGPTATLLGRSTGVDWL